MYTFNLLFGTCDSRHGCVEMVKEGREMYAAADDVMAVQDLRAREVI